MVREAKEILEDLSQALDTLEENATDLSPRATRNVDKALESIHNLNLELADVPHMPSDELTLSVLTKIEKMAPLLKAAREEARGQAHKNQKNLKAQKSYGQAAKTKNNK